VGRDSDRDINKTTLIFEYLFFIYYNYPPPHPPSPFTGVAQPFYSFFYLKKRRRRESGVVAAVNYLFLFKLLRLNLVKKFLNFN
jgi:hypothetical protein